MLIEYMIPMRDGVKLYTLVQLPETGKKLPTIIKRNPYADPDAPPAMEPFRNENTHGYAIVYQECRGTGRSEGDCIPFINERNDGLDTLDWIRKQDFYNGELFLEGQSYLSAVHLSYLKTNQPDVKAACLMIMDTERYNLLYRNGFFKTGLHGGWAINMYKKKTFRKKIMFRKPSGSFRFQVLQNIFMVNGLIFWKKILCIPIRLTPSGKRG